MVVKKKGATKDDGKSGKKEIPRNLCEQHVSTHTNMDAHRRKKKPIFLKFCSLFYPTLNRHVLLIFPNSLLVKQEAENEICYRLTAVAAKHNVGEKKHREKMSFFCVRMYVYQFLRQTSVYESIVCSSFHTYWFHASKNCVGVVLNNVKRCLDREKKKKWYKVK